MTDRVGLETINLTYQWNPSRGGEIDTSKWETRALRGGEATE